MARNMFTWLKELFFQNWSLKVISILLAALTFYAIRKETSIEVRYNVPVEVKVEKGVAVLDQNPRNVSVVFRGSQDSLMRLDQKYMKAVVRPRLAESGKPEHLDVSPNDVSGASGVRIMEISPDTVTVTFDREHTKLLPVIPPKTIGHPLLGSAEVEVEPRFVTIRGPNLRLRDTVSVMTEPVNVDGKVGSFTEQVLVLSPGDTWVSQIEPTHVTAHVTIVNEAAVRKVEKVRILAITNPDSGVQLAFDPPYVNVSLHGREEELAGMPDSSVQVFVNCVGLDPAASYELPVQAHLPPDVSASITLEPQSVRATFLAP